LGRDDHNKPILLSPPPLLNDHDQGDNVNVLELQLEKTSINSDSNLNLENLNFNVSHQGSYIVLASDPIATLIGIDVMNVEKPGRIADSVDEYFR
jgi:phosphopantetheinyl transferase